MYQSKAMLKGMNSVIDHQRDRRLLSGDGDSAMTVIPITVL